MPDHRSVAVAVTHDSPPDVLIAEDDMVISRVIAVELVARTPPDSFASSEQLASVRSALLEERWADAVVEWMAATGSIVDVYAGERIWSEAALNTERAMLEIRVSPIFRD